jgi:hypothetical protein
MYWAPPGKAPSALRLHSTLLKKYQPPKNINQPQKPDKCSESPLKNLSGPIGIAFVDQFCSLDTVNMLMKSVEHLPYFKMHYQQARYLH